MGKFIFFMLLLASPAMADSLIATRVIRAQTVLTESDLNIATAEISGALTQIHEAIGLEARVTLYPGRPIRAADIGPPALVDRNQTVTLLYNVGTLGISTEGRALARGGLGDVIRVMNLSSRTMLLGRIAEDGAVHVGQMP